MRKCLLSAMAGLTLLLGVTACSEEVKYASSVVTQIQLYMDDEPYFVNTGAANKPLFIYEANGEYVANYSSLYRFQLPNGKYRIISTTQSDSIPCPGNLNEIVINQDPAAKMKYAISAPVEYASPFNEPLNVHMYSRTGVLRLKSTDRKADKSYSTVRAVVSSPISGYKISDATFIKSPIEIARDKSTTTGGVNYTDDLVLFETGTDNESVSVRIDYLDANKNVIQSKAIDGTFPILPDDTVQVAFELNNVNEPVIQDYTVTIASEGWTEEDINPEAPERIPEGYTPVRDGEDATIAFNKLNSDPSVTEIKLYLKAGGTYTLNFPKNNIQKAMHIMGEVPDLDAGETYPNLTIGTIIIGQGGDSPICTIDGIRFENLLMTLGGRWIQCKGEKYEVKELSFTNCEFKEFKGTWYQTGAADMTEIIHSFIVDNCRFYDFTGGFLTPRTANMIPFYNVQFKNSTFHMKKRADYLIGGIKSDKKLSMLIENCTFINAEQSDKAIFNLDASFAQEYELTIKNNLFSGTAGGTLFTLNGTMTRTISGNYCTSDFTMGQGLEAGEELTAISLDMNTLFIDAGNKDFTIKDQSSEIYTNNIGDPHWIK